MGSSCSSGSKKDKCSKKKKSETNGGNHSHRGSNASNSSVYVYQKASEAEGKEGGASPKPSALPQAASVASTITPSTTANGGETPLPTPVKPRVERTDSHSAVSVSSPMSPTQLLRQTSKDADQEIGMGRIDLQTIPEHVRNLVVGHIQDVHLLPCSPKALRIVVSRYGMASGEQQQRDAEQQHHQDSERESLEGNVFETLRSHCAERGYELETLYLDEDSPQDDWQWVMDQHTESMVIFLFFISESAPLSLATILPSHLPPLPSGCDTEEDCILLDKYYVRDDNALEDSKRYILKKDVVVAGDDGRRFQEIFPSEIKSGWEWLAERVCSEMPLCRRTVCVWKRLLQSPYPITALQQRLLEVVDETRLIKCSLKWQTEEEGQASGIETEAHQCYVEDLCAQLYPTFTSLIESLLDEKELDGPTMFRVPSFMGVSRQLHSELLEQTRILGEHLRMPSLDTDDIVVKSIIEYLQSDVPWPLVVHGEPGSGKSKVLATATHMCSLWLPNAHLVFRFAHRTRESRSVERLLTNVIEQFCLLLGEPRPSGVQAADLPSLLQRLAPVRPLVVLLDGLDYIVPSSSTSFQWLPSILPDNVRLILTVTQPSPLYDYLRSILTQEAGTEAGFVAIPPLNPQSASNLFRSLLVTRRRTLTPGQFQTYEEFIKNIQNPSHVCLVAYCAHGVTSSTPENSLQLKNDAGSQAEVLLQSLKLELDTCLLMSTFYYLVMSKHGLSVAELSSLLMRSVSSSSSKVSGQLYHHREIVQFIYHLRCRLAPQFLQTVVSGDRTLLRLQHPTFASVVRRFILGDDGSGGDATVEEEGLPALQEVHRRCLTDYWEMAESRFGQRINHRKLEELPHLCGVPLDRFVFNWDWVFLKICGCSTEEFLEDIAEANVPSEQRCEIEVLVDFLHSASLALSYDGLQFYSQAHARMTVLPDANMPHLNALMKSCQQCLPSTSLLCPGGAGCLLSCATPATEQLPEMSRKGALTSLHRVKGNPSFVVSLCTSQDEVVVWNVYEQQVERRLQGVTQPRDIKFIDEHTAVILCNRELCIYDLNEGKFLVKLKGVMNQKMPYYDLHDGDHVVSLSRNRMYVNMTNLTSGDCVATFKVGEDRFLNSLLVSANGRICVCGDETQKPFPLLVWDLSSRKLLYDLRIPHHDFVTNLSAITNDGHYVVCVCQEVSDPIPNFIIVYDLQNGTLFKKWKPDVSTCSVAISSEGGCVVTGLADTSVLVWDLTTGACRNTLIGHTAPVTLIRMDDSGHRCLTADLPKGRDPAIRLWDIGKGICLASFVGDSPITCCELTSNGNAVILGLLDTQTILTLVLVEEGTSLQDTLPPPSHYGNADFRGKRIHFGEKGD